MNTAIAHLDWYPLSSSSASEAIAHALH
jgi:hypothetical protein